MTKKNDDHLSEEEKATKYGDKCPKCGNSWVKTPRLIARDNWWHCKTCNKKAIDIMENEPPPFSTDDVDWADWKIF